LEAERRWFIGTSRQFKLAPVRLVKELGVSVA